MNKKASFIFPTVIIKSSGFFDKAKDGENTYGLADAALAPVTQVLATSLHHRARPKLLSLIPKSTAEKNVEGRLRLSSVNSNSGKSMLDMAEDLGHYNYYHGRHTVPGMSKKRDLFNKALAHSSGIGPIAVLAGLIGSTAADNKDSALTSAIIGAAGGIPEVAKGVLDTKGTYSQIRRHGGGRLLASKSLGMLPFSKALYAALPFLAYKWKEHKGGYTQSNMKKQAAFIIPTVMVKAAQEVVTAPASDPLWVHSPLGDIKPFNSTHGAVGGAALGGLATGAAHVLAQHFTEEGKRRNFRQKLMAALLPSAVVAGGGALLGSTLTNANRAKVIEDSLRTNPTLLNMGTKLKPNIKELITPSIDSYLQDADIRELRNVKAGQNTPRKEQAIEEAQSSVLRDIIGSKKQPKQPQ